MRECTVEPVDIPLCRRSVVPAPGTKICLVESMTVDSFEINNLIDRSCKFA